jgi:hypothetical protein
LPFSCTQGLGKTKGCKKIFTFKGIGTSFFILDQSPAFFFNIHTKFLIPRCIENIFRIKESHEKALMIDIKGYSIITTLTRKGGEGVKIG